jgi:ribosomal protein S15P/S13E
VHRKERERERGRKSIEKRREKLQDYLQIKGEVNILRG